MNPNDKPVSSEVQLEPRQQHQNQIADQVRQVKVSQAVAEQVAEVVQEAREKLPEFQRVSELLEDLETARESLKSAEERSETINKLKEKLASKREDLRADRFDLSMLLVHYMAKYSVKSLVINEEHREIDVSAKVGKKIKKQEALPL